MNQSRSHEEYLRNSHRLAWRIKPGFELKAEPQRSVHTELLIRAQTRPIRLQDRADSRRTPVIDGTRVIKTTSYDPPKHKLTVSFASGRAFVFHSVPARVAALLAQAVDPIAYFNRCVRGRFAWVEMLDGQVVRNVFAIDPFGK
jgi:hypothetical protein